jgi:DNA-directed RNA polymerase beta subunit
MTDASTKTQPILRPILEDSVTRREKIRQATIQGLGKAFPMKAGKWTVELSDARVEPREFSSRDQKMAILEGRTLSERVRGDLTVRDAQGAVTSRAPGFTLLHLPYFTPRHTFILDGTEYSVSNQLRTKPGVYVRRRGNEELEAAFNLSKGSNFKILMEPEKGLLYMQPGSTTARIALYPVLRALDVPHQDVAGSWGAQVAAVNRDAFRSPDAHVGRLYEALIHPSKRSHATPEARAGAIREYLNATSMDPEVNRATLGEPFDKASGPAMLAASNKVLEVHRRAADVDDRDSLSFKTFHSVDDFIRERLQLDARAMRSKLGWKLEASRGAIKDALPAAPLTRAVTGFLTTSSLSAVPMQINPMELVDEASRVTLLGEGAISSERAIPIEARDVHPTHLAIIDPTRVPESFKVGVDLRLGIGARRDDHGNLYAPVRNVRTGKDEYLKAAEMARSIVAFPGGDLRAGGSVSAMKDGAIQRVPASEVTHQVRHMSDVYGATTNLLPLLNGMQGNRALMASKHQGQALPLVRREAPLVQVESWNPGISVEREMVRLIVPTAPVAGRIDKIDADYVHLSPEGEKRAAAEGTVRLHYDHDLPLAAKTYLDNKLIVKEGDVVRAGQPLAESNFTRDGVLALGTNLRVAYMPYRGLNTNDGIVVSQGAADKLTSEHMFHHVLSKAGDVETSREKHRAYFGGRYAARQYDALDESGVVRPGTVLQKGDPIMVGVRRETASGDAALLGKLSKSLVKPYAEVVETWTHDHPGIVADVSKTGERHSATVKTHETLQIGDKISNRYGAKGVVAKIVPDAQMIQDEKGRPVDVILTSAGIITRINPAQLVEASLGKVAEHRGEPILVPQFADRDAVAHAKDLLKASGLSDKETVVDPVTGRSIPGVFVGKSYFLKLFKTTDSNWAAHGAERYDYNQQPARGGDDGAKGIGKMEFDGLVAHNARAVLRESAAIKSQRNDEFWRSIQLGTPTPAPRTPFAYDKLHAMLAGAGVKISKQGSRLALGPLTDADVERMSSGALPEPTKMVRAKDLRPETGGMFDPARTGGMAGTKWSHVELSEPIVNPVFEEPVRRLLGLTHKEFTERTGRGGEWFRAELGRIDVPARLEELRERSRHLRGAALDDAVKQAKYLAALQTHGLRPADAYVIGKVPVTPPIIRPILPLKDGRLQVGDANLLYRDAFLANDRLRESTDVLPASELHAPRRHLYDAVSALFGVGDPVSPGVERRGAKGYIATITGSRPGSGFFQSKLMKRQQDVSGRATIAPDPTLSMDEIGVPEDMLWGMYSKFVVGRLVGRGYSALDAQKLVDDKAPVARDELINESKERPVMVNRAPSLTRHNIIGAYPRITQGKTITLNPFAERGTNADYDGDAMQIHAPVTPAGVEDVKRMTLSHQIFADRKPGMLNVAPDMEAVLGLHRATQSASDRPARQFASLQDARAAYHRGEIALNDPVHVGE